MWILGLLEEGLRDAQDYYVYKKRHVMELVMGFHDSQLSDQKSRVSWSENRMVLMTNFCYLV